MAAKRGAAADPAHTRARLIEAALDTLQHHGYANASARTIAGAAGLNQASIYYHFEGIDGLLVAALLDSSTARLERYRVAIEPLDDLGEVLRTWRRLHEEDVASGSIAALTELVGATGAQPALRDGVNATVALWRELIESTIRRVVAHTPFAGIIPVEDAAGAIFALFLGVELLSHLDADTERANRLFDLGSVLGELVRSR